MKDPAVTPVGPGHDNTHLEAIDRWCQGQDHRIAERFKYIKAIRLFVGACAGEAGQGAALNVACVEGQSMTPSRNFGAHSRVLTSYHSRYDVFMVR